ncbi:hypothetical protein P171DRAFT_163271 [Karstenula rhodostoma CBS 690.94]|uniref:LIM zinc-binding domain-containing protein n=1 Tax=Karstenula rhodostoma CBS 690.94 TaxID=1392251 RepID=A0A9P4U709_9PLEO|nr:hypothetical protein P171DRAFT_163271 [Karstenula rhodostoma CBS 690.94]
MGTDSLSFLPTIKCSDCGIDIEISQLADHVCAPAPLKDAEPASPKMDRAATFGGPSSNKKPDRQSRSARMPPPPRIDPYAANKPFYPGDISPDSSYSDPKSRSAHSPGSGRLPYPMNRSITSPLPQARVHAPEELSSNSDSSFPRFPTARSATPPSARPQARDRLQPSSSYDLNYAQPSPLFAPLSPRMNGGESIMKRMDGIAPGPFTGDRRPSTSSGLSTGDRRPSTSNGPRPPSQGRTPFSHQRTNTQGSVRSNGIASNSRMSTTSNTSRGSVFSNGSSGLPSRPRIGAGPFAAMPPPPLPPLAKDEELDGIDAFLARLQNETSKPAKLDQDSQSKTSPMPEETRDASDPPARPADRMPPPRRSTDIDTQNHYTLSSRSYEPLVSKPMGRKDNLAHLPPALNYARDFSGDTVHTPSDSGLSEDSYASSGFRSVASSRSSPPISEASHSRQTSKVGRLEYPDDEPVRRIQSPEMFLDPRPAPQPERRRGRSPEPYLPPPRAPYIGAPESPIDPAIQMGLSSTIRREEPRQVRDPALNTPRLMNAPPRNLAPEPHREATRRPTTAGKGRCGGCSEQIIGKSVKDSSGRLTGRYHKACFVCRTCRDPFPTAEFYVFNNAPYCEQHYHQLNGSLCRACNRGIEGQYLETDQRLKFHPRCFCCNTCRIPLRDDYYEFGGRNYCERHAYSAVNMRNNYLGAGGNNRMQKLEKRRTRLMMMS